MPLLIEVGMTILRCKGKNVGLNCASSLFWSKVDSVNPRSGFIMVLHECNCEADLLL